MHPACVAPWSPRRTLLPSCRAASRHTSQLCERTSSFAADLLIATVEGGVLAEQGQGSAAGTAYVSRASDAGQAALQAGQARAGARGSRGTNVAQRPRHRPAAAKAPLSRWRHIHP